MPELPEVETVRRILEPIVKDETIASIKVYREKNILTGADLFVSSLIGEKFLSVSRVGKYLLFHLTNDKVIVSHLRMEGKYFERETPKEEKHDILCYVFESGKCLAYNDVRKFGVIELYKENEIMTKSPIHKLGKEPFVMIDGNHKTGRFDNEIALVKGDAKSMNIAAASILAKVYRDRIMMKWDKIYPEYRLSSHKGYPTAEHYEILRKIGPCEIYRKSFRLTKEKESEQLDLF